MDLIRKSCRLPALAVAVLLAIQLACTRAPLPGQTFPACKAGDYSVAQYRSLNPTQQAQLVENYRKQYSPALEKVRATLKDAHLDPPFYVLGRLKTVDSIEEKLSRKEYTCISDLTDIAGVRIIIPSYAALPLVTQSIESMLFIVEKEDFILDQRRTGYRAIHYLTTVNNRAVEIQIHTHRGTLWAEASHRLVYKGPFSGNRAVISYLNRLSDAIFRLDSGLLQELPPVPETLPPPAREDLTNVVAAVQNFRSLSAVELNRFYMQLERQMLERDSFDLDAATGRDAGSQ